jgi:hypothetical protein
VEDVRARTQTQLKCISLESTAGNPMHEKINKTKDKQTKKNVKRNVTRNDTHP